MSDPVSHLKRELLAAAERQQGHTVLAPKSRGRWLERFRAVPGRRRRLVVVLAALALATAAATAGWAIVREVVLDKGFIGLPPVGAPPSAPESGELVIQYRVDLRHPDAVRGWVYADGRLVTLRGSGFLEQRLTPEGVELLRSEIVSTGLFDQDQPPGSTFGVHNVIQVRIGDRLVRVQADFPERLRRQLADPESWLPASAWANRRIRAYVGSRYAITYGGQFQTVERSRILALLPAPAEDLLRDQDAVPRLGFITGKGFRISLTHYVSDLTTEEARALAQALDDAGLKQPMPAALLAYRFEIPGTSVDPPPPAKGPVQNAIFIIFEPYLPHGEWECSLCG